MIRDEETGQFLTGCLYNAVPSESFEMVAYHGDWEKGHNPVSTGRAPWLPSPFIQGMHTTRAYIAEETMAASERARLKHATITGNRGRPS